MTDDDKSLSIRPEDKEKVESMIKNIHKMLEVEGIDFKAIIEERQSKLFPAIPKEFREDAETILIQTTGVFTLSNIGQAHQNDIPDFEYFMCDTCDEELGPEHAYWIALGNQEILRVICPNCNTKVGPLGMPIEKTKRLNENEPSIKAAMELAGIKGKEQIVDIGDDELDNEYKSAWDVAYGTKSGDD